MVAGVDLAKHIFTYIDPQVKFDQKIEEGSEVKYGDIVFEVECNSRSLLLGERLVLNAMQRMSGISSLSKLYADLLRDLPVEILDTRKTTPLNRFLEKWAVSIGGCSNYRFGLFDRIMIKDNHVDACGSITSAMQKADQYRREKSLDIEMTVEVRDLEELQEVLNSGVAERVMLDNFSLELMRQAVGLAKGKIEVEASGGITLQTIRSVAETGVDFISSGALTHSAKNMDMSLKVIK